MKKKTSLAKLINNRALTIFTITVTILVGVMMYFFISESLNYSTIYGDTLLKNGALKIERTIEKYKVLTKGIRSNIYAELELSEKERNRDQIISQLKNIRSEFNEVLGIYILFEENKFDNNDEAFKNKKYHDKTGRFIPYVNREKIEPAYGYQTLEYYQECKKSKQLYITDPYDYIINKKSIEMISISYPIIKDNEFMGVVGIDLSLDLLKREANHIKIYGDNASVALLDRSGHYLTHSHKKELIGENLSKDCNDPELRIDFLKNGEFDHWFEKEGVMGIIGCLTAPIKINEFQTPWQLQAKVHAKYVFIRLIKALWWIFFIIICSIFLTIYLLRRTININLRPLIKLQEISEEIADGNLTKEINIESNNEIGLLVNSYQIMSRKLNEFVGQVKRSANTINVASVQLKDSSEELSASSSEQASITEEISSSIEEMSASVQEVAAKTNEIIDKGNEILKDTKHLTSDVEKSNELQEAVVESVKIINEIAQNIRILALNAAVEAARAGDNGKGFTVVAREVQKLSERTTVTAKDIVEKTNQTYNTSLQGTRFLKETVNKFIEFNKHISTVNLAVQEQAQSIQQISMGTVDLNQTTQNNASSSEELSSTSKEMNTQANELSNLTKGFITTN